MVAEDINMVHKLVLRKIFKHSYLISKGLIC
nr:MAG TPA: hypothetical protein [Caudoviricetes sp.]